jgi:RimJ/RimL family protein N-acetyltransferase
LTGTTIEAPILETERLRLRMLQAEDFDQYAVIHMGPEVTRFTSRAQLSRADAFRHMAALCGHWHLRGYGMWAVEEKATGRLVGRVGFHEPEEWPAFELGWTIGRADWGKGYATEAARRCMRYAFEEMRRKHVISLIDPENVRSIAVAERLGETIERDVILNGYRVLVFGITDAAWAAKSG